MHPVLAGEQRNRRYDWGALDPVNHTFGTPAGVPSSNVIRCLLGPDRPSQVLLCSLNFNCHIQ